VIEVKVVKRTFDYLVDELNYTLWIDNHPISLLTTIGLS